MVAVDPPTRPVLPSTSTWAVLEVLLLHWAWVASLEPEGAAVAGAGGTHALTTMPMAPNPYTASAAARARWAGLSSS